MRRFLLVVCVVLTVAYPWTANAQCWYREWSEPSQDYLWDIDFVDDTTGWAVRYGPYWGSTIIHSTDAGATWSVQGSPSHSLYCVDFLDLMHGWAGGVHSVYRTTNGGANWIMTENAADDLMGINFANENAGWAVGHRASATLIRHTVNGGVDWYDQAPAAGTGVFNGVDCSSASSAWVVGDNGSVGLIERTTNGGSVWTAQTSGVSWTLYGVDFVDATNGWVVGGHGTILHTTDAGSTWLPQTSGTTATLTDVAFSSATQGWAIGDSAIILQTTDSGASWARYESGLGDHSWIYGISALADDHVWAAGDSLAGDSGPNMDFVLSHLGNHFMRVVDPNGGELWPLGSAQEFRWASCGYTSNPWVGIQLNRNYPSGAWEVIAAAANDDGSYPWTVTGPSTNHARIRFYYPMHAGVEDISDADFTIGFPAPENLTAKRGTGGPPFYLDLLHLYWNPVVSSNPVTYNVYLDSEPDGTFTTLVGSTADTSYTMLLGASPDIQFYIVKAETTP